MHRGYIKLWRKGLDTPFLKNPVLWTFWTWCLMKASHQKHTVMVGLQEITLNPGDFVFGRNQASTETGISQQKIRTCLKYLEKAQNLTIKPTNKFSIISITNWDIYQSDNGLNNQQPNQQTTNKQPTNNQQITTNKNVKNVKNDKEQITRKLKRRLPDDFVLNDSLKTYATENGIDPKKVDELFKRFQDYHIGHGTKMLDWNRAWYTFVKNAPQFSPWAMKQGERDDAGRKFLERVRQAKELVQQGESV